MTYSYSHDGSNVTIFASSFGDFSKCCWLCLVHGVVMYWSSICFYNAASRMLIAVHPVMWYIFTTHVCDMVILLVACVCLSHSYLLSGDDQPTNVYKVWHCIDSEAYTSGSSGTPGCPAEILHCFFSERHFWKCRQSIYHWLHQRRSFLSSIVVLVTHILL